MKTEIRKEEKRKKKSKQKEREERKERRGQEMKTPTGKKSKDRSQGNYR